MNSWIAGRGRAGGVLAGVFPSRVLAAVIGLIIATACPARAQVTVAKYTFSGSSVATSSTYPGVTDGDFIAGSGLASGTQFLFNDDALGVYSNYTPATETAAVSGSDYLSFTVTPTQGPLVFNDLYFDLYAYANNIQGDYDPVISVLSSINNFSTIITTASTSVSPGDQVETGGEADFSSFGQQAVDAPVEFRFYFSDNQDESYYTDMGIGYVFITGTPIPEPSSWALGALGLIALGVFTHPAFRAGGGRGGR